jgi:biopolymer transport protein ExbD
VHLPQARRAPAVTAPLTITIPLSFRQDRKLRFGNELIGLDVLGERVRQDLANRLSKDVLLAGDTGITLGETMSVFDKLREGGVDKVGIQTQPTNAGRRP